MKLAKRISIALLAACIVGGSAFAMSACGGGTEPAPSSEPAVSQTEDSSSGETDLQPAAMDLENLNMISGQMVRVLDNAVEDRFDNQYDGGVQYDASENSYGTYNLDRKYVTFSATAYVSAEATEGKDIWISVYADDRLVYHKEGITENTQPFTIHADVSGGNTMKIETGNEGSFSCGYLILSDGKLFDERLVMEKTEEQSDEKTAAADYSGAYLNSFDAQPFQAALDDAVDQTYSRNERFDTYDLRWYDDWEDLAAVSEEEPAADLLKEGEVPVSCQISLYWMLNSESDPQEFHLYLGYDAENNSLRAVKMNVYRNDGNTFYGEDDAQNAIMQMLAILDLD